MYKKKDDPDHVENHDQDRMERKNHVEQLVDIIVIIVEIEQEDIKPESRFMEDLGFTSFDFMSMLGEIEDEMDVEIEQDKAADIRTVGEAVAYLESLK